MFITTVRTSTVFSCCLKTAIFRVYQNASIVMLMAIRIQGDKNDATDEIIEAEYGTVLYRIRIVKK